MKAMEILSSLCHKEPVQPTLEVLTSNAQLITGINIENNQKLRLCKEVASLLQWIINES